MSNNNVRIFKDNRDKLIRSGGQVGLIRLIPDELLADDPPPPTPRCYLQFVTKAKCE